MEGKDMGSEKGEVRRGREWDGRGKGGEGGWKGKTAPNANFWIRPRSTSSNQHPLR